MHGEFTVPLGRTNALLVKFAEGQRKFAAPWCKFNAVALKVPCGTEFPPCGRGEVLRDSADKIKLF